MKLNSLLIMMITGFLFASCNTVKVNYDYDRMTNFNSYKTYNFHQKGIDKLEVNDLDKRRIVSAIEANLASKGFMKTDANPDLYINILASSKEKIDVNNNYWGYWGPYYGGPSRVYQYTSGTIIIDVIDNQKNVLVWQGAGSGLDVSNLDRKDEDIPKAVNEILAKFPPPAK